jgi:hypothetical protein
MEWELLSCPFSIGSGRIAGTNKNGVLGTTPGRKLALREFSFLNTIPPLPRTDRFGEDQHREKSRRHDDSSCMQAQTRHLRPEWRSGRFVWQCPVQRSARFG